jgi:hypothetical protein
MVETIPTFVPGDYITYVVYLAYPGNLKEVRAEFRHEKSGNDVEGIKFKWEIGSSWPQASWEEQLDPHPRSNGKRTHVAIFSEEVGVYHAKFPGIYRLDTLSAKTYLGKRLTIDSPPRAAFRIEAEPDTTVLPSSAVLPPTGFHLPEGHPDRPQGE